VRIDLHLHSAASDGCLAPAALARAAGAAGLDLIALTDHDTTAGVAEAVAATPPGLTILAGIEVTSTYAGTDLHILGYLVDPAHPILTGFAAAAHARRVDRMHGMIHRLQGLGIPIDFEEVVAAAGGVVGNLGRPHLARVLVERGVVESLQAAFDDYLGDGRPAYLPVELATPREAIDLIRGAGGIAVWAHPPLDVLEAELGRFIAWGLEGLECRRPRRLATEVKRLVRTARRHGLLITGGSDWHDPSNGALGEFHLSGAEVAGFLERCG